MGDCGDSEMVKRIILEEKLCSAMFVQRFGMLVRRALMLGTCRGNRSEHVLIPDECMYVSTRKRVFSSLLFPDRSWMNEVVANRSLQHPL